MRKVPGDARRAARGCDARLPRSGGIPYIFKACEKSPSAGFVPQSGITGPVVDGRVGRRGRGGGRVTKGEVVVVVALINKTNNPVNIRLKLCSLQ